MEAARQPPPFRLGSEGLDLAAMERLGFRRLSLQAMDGPEQAANMRLAVALCLAHPQWRLSVQTHKVLEIR